MDLVGDAIKALGRIGEEKAAPAVLNFARRVSRRRVFGSAAEGRLVARAIETLAQIGGSSMVHEVETFVVHPDREIGEAARKAVLQLEKEIPVVGGRVLIQGGVPPALPGRHPSFDSSRSRPMNSRS
ncbi:MAG: hypothetical protein M5R36_05260 [Deltaproteobacteria bacterium]|nr:hypothetical protein [Deltaproteobacteria bacterium]